MIFLRWLHVVAAAILAGASLSAVVASRVASRSKADPRSADAVGHALWRLANAGLGLLLLTGVGSLAAYGNVSAFMKQPWMHLMLTCFLVAGALAGIGGKRARQLAEGDADDPAKTRASLGALALVQLAAALAAIAAGVFRF